MIQLSLKELITMHTAGFVAICIALFLIIVCVVFLVVRRKQNVPNKKTNAEEYLIRETLDEMKEEQAAPKEAKKAEPKKEEPVKKEAPKAEPVKKAEPKKEAAPKEAKKVEPKEESKPVKKEAAPKEAKKAEPKKEEPAKKAEPKKAEDKKEEEKKKRVLNGKYEVYTDGAKYFYLLKASNGEVLVVSEMYASKDSVYNAIDAIKRNSVDGRVLVAKDKKDLYQFTLLAKNNRKLVMSANYPTERGAVSASESFKRFAANSNIVEISEPVTPLKEEINVDRSINKLGGKLGIIGEDGNFFYQLKASNGEVLINSDNYKTADMAKTGLDNLIAAIPTCRFFVEKDKRGMFQFKIYSNLGRLIVASETYVSKTNAINACNSLLAFINKAVFSE